jgi:hypothetical protein
MPGEDISFLTIVFLDPRNHPEIDSLPREETHHTQIDVTNRNTVRECPLLISLSSSNCGEGVGTAYFKRRFEF